VTDLVHDIEIEVLKGIAILIGSGILWGLKWGLNYLGIKLSEARMAAVERAVDKSMTLAVTQLGDVIHEKGWDHIETRNAVVSRAMEVVEDKFGDTLRRGKVYLDDPLKRIGLMEQMQRMWPDLSTRLSASPATPESNKPDTAAVLVHPETQQAL
jgi:hypothetical protein